MEATQSKTGTSTAPTPSPSRRHQRRVRKFHALLSEETFVDFVQPVTLDQVEQAIEFLDQNFGPWQKRSLGAAADYVLPAIHKLFPAQRRFGFVAPFGPKQTPREGFGQWLNRCVFGSVGLTASVRRESREAR
jgi:hypothetical protein